MRIPMSRPFLTEAEVQAVREVFESGWLGEGDRTAEFEGTLKEYTGSLHVVAVNNGTSAIHLALDVLGVGPGDEVILPSFTFASDPMAVLLCGATPVFADIDPHTLNLDPRRIEPHITPRTRVVMPTDYAGLPADIQGTRRVLGDRDIKIVRDAAHSFGSYINGRPVGIWCGEDATCFSFDAIKNLTCGEGGAVLVSTDELADRIRRKKTLGFKVGSRTRAPGSAVKVRGVIETGYRYHMSDINAAIGLAQFRRFPEIAEKKRKVARQYDRLLADCQPVRTFPRNYEEVVPFIYPVRVSSSRRDRLIESLARNGIHADLRYSPCHQEPLFAQERSELPVTEAVAREIICLPIYAGLETGEVEEIVSLIKDYLGGDVGP